MMFNIISQNQTLHIWFETQFGQRFGLIAERKLTIFLVKIFFAWQDQDLWPEASRTLLKKCQSPLLIALWMDAQD